VNKNSNMVIFIPSDTVITLSLPDNWLYQVIASSCLVVKWKKTTKIGTLTDPEPRLQIQNAVPVQIELLKNLHKEL